MMVVVVAVAVVEEFDMNMLLIVAAVVDSLVLMTQYFLFDLMVLTYSNFQQIKNHR
jgi:hypothetical protein